MSISIQDMFTIGIGPSSSHTVGPMRASYQFVQYLKANNCLTNCHRVVVTLFGSLAHTGIGHGTDKALILGLIGRQPETLDPTIGHLQIEDILHRHRLPLPERGEIDFNYDTDIIFEYKTIQPGHPNCLSYSAFDDQGKTLCSRSYYSVGGGFIHDQDSLNDSAIVDSGKKLTYSFNSAKQLLQQCADNGLSISALMLENETAWRTKLDTENYLLNVWQTMEDCIERGCHTEGILPGGLKVKRRAAHLFRKLRTESENDQDPLKVMDWVNLYALAVNEENAAGGRVVTAPTNGAAGIIPAVLSYFKNFKSKCDDQTIVRYLLTAGAVGILFKENASISGAEVGCQGEVGVACSMAAAGLAEILGGSPQQCEVAAEIGMEHNLGLTCDPVGGLVQIPCIERNAMAAVTAINAARLALHGDGSHKVSLDEAIQTMKETGQDMRSKYKETARGGLAVNLIEC